MKIPSKCPICGEGLYVETLRCSNCNTAVTNKFEIGKFDRLTNTQADFVLTFLGCEGNIKEMEKILGISYPTVKSRLADIQNVLGISVKSKADRQMEILEMIESGEIDVEKAAEMLKMGE